MLRQLESKFQLQTLNYGHRSLIDHQFIAPLYMADITKSIVFFIVIDCFFELEQEKFIKN